MILLGGYNQLIKGDQITKQTTCMISRSNVIPTQIKF